MKLAFIVSALLILAVLGCAPESTVTPRPSPTAVPTPTPMIPLSETERAALWVHVSNGDFFLQVEADPAFEIDQFDLAVFVDGLEYCNVNRIYDDEGPRELSCQAEERTHSSVQRVSAQTSMGDLRCERNNASTARKTIFACMWR